MGKKIRIAQPKDQVVFTQKLNKKGNYVDCNVRLKFKSTFSDDKSELMQKAQILLDSETMRVLEPYMPLYSGMLIKSMIKSSTAGNGEIHVNTPYAAKVNYVSGVMGRNGTLRGRLFFDRMKADKLEYLKTFVSKSIGVIVK